MHVPFHLPLLIAALTLAVSRLALASDASSVPAAPLRVANVLVTLIEQVTVPAQEKGVLSSVDVHDGELVQAGDLLAQIDDADSRLARDRAKIEHDIATRQSKNDVKVRFAKKAWELAKAEHRRAIESIEKYKKSVSQSELDQLRLIAEKAELEIEQAEIDLEVASLEANLKENELQLATRGVDRRKILAPIGGVVVEVKRHAGEFVESGQTMARILRVDRLRAEGFVSAKSLAGNPTGRKTLLTVEVGDRKLEVPGALVFVSPEVNPISGQVRVWAEFDNPDLLLRPGLQGSMIIHAGTK